MRKLCFVCIVSNKKIYSLLAYMNSKVKYPKSVILKKVKNLNNFIKKKVHNFIFITSGIFQYTYFN